jgi:hypothetical protein
VKNEADLAKESASVLGESQPLDPNQAQRLLVHPLRDDGLKLLQGIP